MVDHGARLDRTQSGGDIGHHRANLRLETREPLIEISVAIDHDFELAGADPAHAAGCSVRSGITSASREIPSASVTANMRSISVECQPL